MRNDCLFCRQLGTVDIGLHSNSDQNFGFRCLGGNFFMDFDAVCLVGWREKNRMSVCIKPSLFMFEEFVRCWFWLSYFHTDCYVEWLSLAAPYHRGVCNYQNYSFRLMFWEEFRIAQLPPLLFVFSKIEKTIKCSLVGSDESGFQRCTQFSLKTAVGILA